MNIVLKLNYDVIGIIYDLLSDDFDFFLFIRDNNLSPQRILYTNNLDWYTISKRNLSDNLIFEFASELDWDYLTYQHRTDIPFIRKYQDYIQWHQIDKLMSFEELSDHDFYEEFGCYLDWDAISKFRYMDEQFVDRFHEVLNWHSISRHH